MIIKEEDVSGGTAVAKRRLSELLARVERGISHGIVVYETDRFGRDLRETLNAHHRINEMNGRLVGVEDGVDTSTPSGKSRLVQRAMMAEEYLDDVTRRWQRTTDRRVAQGKSIGHVPFGYRRRDQVPKLQDFDASGNLIKDSRLVVDDGEAEMVLRGFQMRASGASHLDIAREIGRKRITVTTMLKNRVYLGEIRGSGGAINREAHDPIVSHELFAAVQARQGVKAANTGRTNGSYAPMLSGLIRCAECGYLLQISYSKRAKGPVKTNYHCMSPSSNRPCAGCAADAERVDKYVRSQLDLNNEVIRDLYQGAERAWVAARRQVEEAETALSNYVEAASSLDAGLFQRGLDVRQRAVNEANLRLYELDDPGIGDEDLIVLDLGPMKKDLYAVATDPDLTDIQREQRVRVLYDEAEPFVFSPDLERKRLRRVIASVTLKKADPGRRRWQPIDERVLIRWMGEGDAVN